jgi:hypothetical protein
MVTEFQTFLSGSFYGFANRDLLLIALAYLLGGCSLVLHAHVYRRLCQRG